MSSLRLKRNSSSARSVKRPEWKDWQHEPNKYKLSREEVIRKKIMHVSKHQEIAREEYRKKLEELERMGPPPSARETRASSRMRALEYSKNVSRPVSRAPSFSSTSVSTHVPVKIRINCEDAKSYSELTDGVALSKHEATNFVTPRRASPVVSRRRLNLLASPALSDISALTPPNSTERHVEAYTTQPETLKCVEEDEARQSRLIPQNNPDAPLISHMPPQELRQSPQYPATQSYTPAPVSPIVRRFDSHVVHRPPLGSVLLSTPPSSTPRDNYAPSVPDVDPFYHPAPSPVNKPLLSRVQLKPPRRHPSPPPASALPSTPISRVCERACETNDPHAIEQLAAFLPPPRRGRGRQMATPHITMSHPVPPTPAYTVGDAWGYE